MERIYELNGRFARKINPKGEIGHQNAGKCQPSHIARIHLACESKRTPEQVQRVSPDPTCHPEATLSEAHKSVHGLLASYVVGLELTSSIGPHVISRGDVCTRLGLAYCTLVS